MYNKFDYMNYILNYDQNKMVWKWVNECERQKLFSWNCCTSSAEFSHCLNPAEIYFKLWLEFRARALNFRHSALTWADEPLQLKFGSCLTCLCTWDTHANGTIKTLNAVITRCDLSENHRRSQPGLHSPCFTEWHAHSIKVFDVLRGSDFPQSA